MSSPAADVLRDLGRMLDAAGVDWYLFGAQAALLRGARLVEAVAEGLGEDDIRRALAELKRRAQR
jgi:hypothetical protein